MAKQKKLIVLAGATASGKTTTAIRLAQHFNTAIISADSRQFYKELSIGTAKPSSSELAAATHYGINTISIDQQYNVGDFEKDCLAWLTELYQQHDVVILAGGSGLFIKAVCEGLDEFPTIDPNIRIQLKQEWETNGIISLQEQLREADPTYYQQVDLNNPQRLIRALEICRATGKPYSAFRKAKPKERFFTPVYVLLEWERSVLYERINQRVDNMLEAGLLEEARQLFPKRKLNALQTVGYQEFFEYFDGKITFDEAVELVKRNSRRYAKRQMTWFRRDPHWKSFGFDDYNDMLRNIESDLK